MALAPITVTPERTQVLDFCDSIRTSLRVTALYKPESGQTMPTSWQDLANKEGLQFGVIRGSDIEDILRQSTHPVLARIWHNISSRMYYGYVYNMYEGLERVRQENFVLMMNLEEAAYHASSQPCDISMMSNPIDIPVYQTIAFGKDSEFMQAFNEKLSELRSDSVTWSGLRRKWWSSECGNEAAILSAFDEHLTSVTATSITTSPHPHPGAVETSSPPPTQRRHLTITTMLTEPYLMRTRGGDRRYQGYLVDLVHRLADIVPFDFTWRIQKGFGRKQRGDRQPTGMIGDLLTGAADLAASPFIVDPRQERFLSFTKPFLHSTLSILLQDPDAVGAGDEWPVFFMEDLLNHTDLSLGVIKGSRAEKVLKKSKVDLYKQIWRKIKFTDTDNGKKKKSNNIISDLDQGLVRVRQGDFALIIESLEAAYVSSKPPCDLLALDQFMSITHYAFALKKDSPLVTEIDEAMLQLQQDGVLQQLFHTWWNSGECLQFGEEQGDHNGTNNKPFLYRHSDRDLERIVTFHNVSPNPPSITTSDTTTPGPTNHNVQTTGRRRRPRTTPPNTTPSTVSRLATTTSTTTTTTTKTTSTKTSTAAPTTTTTTTTELTRTTTTKRTAILINSTAPATPASTTNFSQMYTTTPLLNFSKELETSPASTEKTTVGTNSSPDIPDFYRTTPPPYQTLTDFASGLEQSGQTRNWAEDRSFDLELPDEGRTHPAYTRMPGKVTSRSQQPAEPHPQPEQNFEWFFVTHEPRPVEYEEGSPFTTRGWDGQDADIDIDSDIDVDTGPIIDIEILENGGPGQVDKEEKEKEEEKGIEKDIAGQEKDYSPSSAINTNQSTLQYLLLVTLWLLLVGHR